MFIFKLNFREREREEMLLRVMHEPARTRERREFNQEIRSLFTQVTGAALKCKWLGETTSMTKSRYIEHDDVFKRKPPPPPPPPIFERFTFYQT